MLTVCLVLLLIGVGLLIIEMFIPGFGVCGVTALILLALSAVLAVIYVPYGWVFVSLEALVITGLLLLIFRYFKKNMQGKLVLGENLNEDSDRYSGMDSFLGREGVARTTLRPFGTVDFNGVLVDSCSEGEYIEKGRRVKVVEVKNQRVTVSQI